MSELAYVASKYAEAVEVLAVSPGKLQVRIHEAAMAAYGFPNPDCVPPAIRARIDELHAALTKYPLQEHEREYRGAYQATLARIRTPTAVKIARLIVEIEALLCDAVESELTR